MKMYCQKCDGTNIRIHVDLTVSIDADHAHRINKTTFRDKEVELWSANWPKAQVICNDCGFVSIGC